MRSILDYKLETKPLEPSVQEELLRRVKTLDTNSVEFKEVMDELIMHNLKLIAKYAKGLYDKKSMEIDDVISLAIPGLRKAILKFEPEKGVPFAIYCRKWLVMEIRRNVFKETFSSHLSVRDYELIMAYLSTETRLLNELNGDYDQEDVFEEMHLTNKQIDKLIDLLNISSVASLNSYYDEDNELELIDIIAADSTSNVAEFAKAELQNDVQYNILLNKAVYDMTYKDIAAEYNLSLKEVKSLYDDGIRKLKNSDIAEAVRSS